MLCSETGRLCWHLHKWSIIKAWFSSAYYSSLSSLHFSSWVFWLWWTSQRYVPLASSCRSNRKTCCRDDFDLWITIDITCEDGRGDDHSSGSKGITSTRIPFWGKIWSFGRSLGTNLEHHKLTFSLHWLTILSPIWWPSLHWLPVKFLLISVPLYTVESIPFHVKPIDFCHDSDNIWYWTSMVREAPFWNVLLPYGHCP